MSARYQIKKTPLAINHSKNFIVERLTNWKKWNAAIAAKKSNKTSICVLILIVPLQTMIFKIKIYIFACVCSIQIPMYYVWFDLRIIHGVILLSSKSEISFCNKCFERSKIQLHLKLKRPALYALMAHVVFQRDCEWKSQPYSKSTKRLAVFLLKSAE